MNKYVIFSLLCLFIIVTGCQKKEEPLTLKVDYSTQKEWTYSVSYTSQGLFTQNDSTTTMNTVINSRLTGTTDTPDKLKLAVTNIQITSDMLKDEEKQQIIEKLSKAEYDLAMQDGTPTIDTTTELPAGSFPEWDLYTQFAKLLPSLPGTAVKKGFTWERTATLPIRTVQGIVPCEIYRSYTVDSLTEDNAVALISWQFRYSTEKEVIDSTNFMKQIPVAGSGTGTAQFDCRKKAITRATMQFETPLAKIGEVSVNWREEAVLQLEAGE